MHIEVKRGTPAEEVDLSAEEVRGRVHLLEAVSASSMWMLHGVNMIDKSEG